MKLINTKINGLKILKTKIYKDKRGYFKEVFKKKCIKRSSYTIKIFTGKTNNRSARKNI